MEIFERAARLKLRFETKKGQLSAEDLWDLPLSSTTERTNLNSIAISLHQKLKDTPISFVDAVPSGDRAATQLRFDVVKHVIDVRLAENAARAAEQERGQKRQRIMELISHKEDEALAGKSADELRELLESL